MKTVRNIRLFFILGVFTSMPCSAFWIFSKKKQKKDPALKFLINEEFIIKRNLVNEKDENYEVALAIYIPREKDFVTIFNTKDESNNKAIENINWIAESSKKKAKPVFEKPFQIKKEVNQNAENLAMNFDPTKAYDMVTEKKHIYNQLFFYKQSNIFLEEKKPRAHFLEISFSDGEIGKIRIDDNLYNRPLDLVPQLFQKKDKDLLEEQYKQYEAEHQKEMMRLQKLQEELRQPELPSNGLPEPNPRQGQY